MLQVGDVVEFRYRVESLLGRGGMALTYKAMEFENSRSVVLKTPLFGPYTRENEEAEKKRRSRFVREAQILEVLDHENIPKFYGQGRHHGQPYIAMEHIDGRNLEDYLRTNRPRVTEAVCLAVSVARALRATHARRILHRDIKPDNIMITYGGWVHVIDFGIALPTDGDATRYTQSSVGTPGYKAPEQIKRSDDVQASDLYGLGCVFYLMLSGHEPFDVHGSDLEVDARHLNDTPERLTGSVRDLPAEVDDLVLGLLEKEIDNRPTCDEVIETLTPYLPAEGEPEPNPGFDIDLTMPYREPERARKRDRRRSPGSAPNPRFRRSRRTTYLTRDTIRIRIADAERQVTISDTKTADTSLRMLLEETIKAYGRSHEMVNAVRQALADVERLGSQL